MRRNNNLFGLEYLGYGGGAGKVGGGADKAGGTPAPGAAGKAEGTSKDSPDVIQGEGNKFWVAKVQDNQTGDKLYALKDGVAKDGAKSDPPAKAPTGGAKKTDAPKGGGKPTMGASGG